MFIAYLDFQIDEEDRFVAVEQTKSTRIQEFLKIRNQNCLFSCHLKNMSCAHQERSKHGSWWCSLLCPNIGLWTLSSTWWSLHPRGKTIRTRLLINEGKFGEIYVRAKSVERFYLTWVDAVWGSVSEDGMHVGFHFKNFFT